MDGAEAQELGLAQAGDHPEDPLLLGVRQPRLEADQVVGGAVAVLGAQLHHRVRAPAGAGIAQADRLHRPERQHVAPAIGHHLDGQAALEVLGLLEGVGQHLAPAAHRLDEGGVFVGGHRAVQVVAGLVVAGDDSSVPLSQREARKATAVSMVSASTMGAMAS